jgi:hypothetical protein
MSVKQKDDEIKERKKKKGKGAGLINLGTSFELEHFIT